MIRNAVLAIVVALGLVGCVTTRGGQGTGTAVSNAQQQETRVSDLEKAVQDKDTTIRGLEEQLDNARRTEHDRYDSNRNDRLEKSDADATSKKVTNVSKATKKQIQAALKNAGFYNGPVDGKFGQLTTTAVKEFQKANNLKDDGKVGQQTWAKLSEHL